MVTRILVIDDDPACRFVWETLSSPEIMVDFYAGPPAQKPPDPLYYDLIVSAYQMIQRDSFRRFREALPNIPLILIVPAGKPEIAGETGKWEIWDYLHRPFTTDTVRAVVRHLIQVQEVYKKSIETPPPPEKYSRFIGTSCTMMAFYRQVARVADSSASVLIEGESGTGKELTARALHYLSVRRDSPFRVIHCGAIPGALLESELFGYEKGAFTGADHPHPGLIETAQGGSLFLDEISEMAPALQGKLLRFLQNGEVRRLGGHAVRYPAVRVIASTNRDMDVEVIKHRFRADLMFRFVVRLKTPPLREHKEDLPQLVEAILQRIALPGIRVSPETMALFYAYDWPGNVRELENILHQTHLFSPYPIIRPEYLPKHFHHPPAKEPLIFTPLQTAERNQIMQTIQNQGWNRTRTARILGIDRKTLRLKMHFYGLEKEGS